MYEKEYNLINLLLNNNRYTTNAEIQRSLKISRRTVINYIKNINSTYKVNCFIRKGLFIR